jgi:solute carrier family 8 (sodium/calcium exchanger)
VSPDVVEWWEGVLTFMFFPFMCVLAYLADKGVFHKMFSLSTDGRKELVLSPDTSPEEMAEMMVIVLQKYGEDSEEHMEDLLKLEFHPKTSRAQHRCRAIHNMCASKKVLPNQLSDLIKIKPVGQKLQSVEEEKKASQTIDDHTSEVTFASRNYMVRESAGKVDIELLRIGDLESQATVRVKTMGGTAEENADYEAVDEVVIFEKGEESKKVTIKIMQDDLPEDTEVFYVTLCSTSQSHPDNFANIGGIDKCDVLVIDDDHPGKLRFDVESIDITESDQMQEKDIPVTVHRQKGTSGHISVNYRCEDVSAVRGRDYRCEEGELKFAPGQASAVFTMTILPKGRLEAKEQFRIIIEDGSEGVEFDETTDGKADCCILTVNILGSQQTKGNVAQLMGRLKPNYANMALGSESWKSQFTEAIYVGGSKEEQQESGLTERILHVILLPWKLLCAFVPPPNISEGYPCFACSLILIGFMTAMIGDLASLLGCALQINDQITAITIVALGTSLPDTFASKSAAIHDDTADASIGNVTGSNSVNVFLGLGLPWMIAGIYWEVVGCNLDDLADPWVKQGHEAKWWEDLPHIKRDYPGKFVVPAGELASNVAVFTVCALLTLMTLVLRRRFLGAELGGPAVAKYATGAFFVLLWFTYIGLSIIMSGS